MCSIVLPPLDSWPRALAAAAACLAGALGAREELGHELRDVGKLRVGVQHVHGLFHFLSHLWVIGVDHFGQQHNDQQGQNHHHNHWVHKEVCPAPGLPLHEVGVRAVGPDLERIWLANYF